VYVCREKTRFLEQIGGATAGISVSKKRGVTGKKGRGGAHKADKLVAYVDDLEKMWVLCRYLREGGGESIRPNR